MEFSYTAVRIANWHNYFGNMVVFSKAALSNIVVVAVVSATFVY